MAGSRKTRFVTGPYSSRRSRLARTNRRQKFSPQRKLEVARVRKLGACDLCRRRKTRCIHALMLVPANDIGSKSSAEEKEASSLLEADPNIIAGAVSSTIAAGDLYPGYIEPTRGEDVAGSTGRILMTQFLSPSGHLDEDRISPSPILGAVPPTTSYQIDVVAEELPLAGAWEGMYQVEDDLWNMSPPHENQQDFETAVLSPIDLALLDWDYLLDLPLYEWEVGTTPPVDAYHAQVGKIVPEESIPVPMLQEHGENPVHYHMNHSQLEPDDIAAFDVDQSQRVISCYVSLSEDYHSSDDSGAALDFQ